MNKKIKAGIFMKFLLVMLLVSLIPLLFLGLRSVIMNKGLSDTITKISSDAHSTAILDKQIQVSKGLADSIDDYFAAVHQNVLMAVSSIRRKDISSVQKRRIIESVYATSRDFLAIKVEDKGSNFYFSTPPRWNFNREELSKLVSKASPGNFILSSPYFTDAFVAVDYCYSWRKGSYFFVVLNLNRIVEKLKNAPSNVDEEVFVVDSQGRIVIHPDFEKMRKGEKLDYISLIKDFVSSFQMMSAEFNGPRNIPMIGAVVPSRQSGWGVVTWQTKSTAYAPIAQVKVYVKNYTHRLLKIGVLQLIIIIIISFIASFILSKNISNPILELSKGALRVAKGDFSTPVKVKSKDEIGELTRIFNSMMVELKRYIDMQADKLDALVFSIREGLVMIDEKNRIILTNEAGRKILLLEESSIGSLLLDEIKRPEAKKVVSNLIESSDEKTKGEINFIQEGVQKFFEVQNYPVKTREGSLIGSILTFRDITIEKQLAQMKDDFLHSITHDLRSPMTSIRGFLEILLDETVGPLNEEQKNFLKIMDESSEKLLTLINNLLDISKLEAGKMPLHLKETRVDKIARRLVEFFKPQADSLKINLVFEASNEIQPIMADAVLIERVITNLISNALKFTPAGGKITVSVKDDYPEKGLVCVSVSDTGRGIPEEEKDKVFEKYHQVSDTSQKHTGTGLGLTVCKYIVEEHKGKIWVDSVYGKGSTFSFYIPKDLYKEGDEIKRKK